MVSGGFNTTNVLKYGIIKTIGFNKMVINGLLAWMIWKTPPQIETSMENNFNWRSMFDTQKNEI